MALAPLLAISLATWFGPTQAAFDARFPGNPYDFRANDVRVVFTAVDGQREERLAYFDDGKWKAWLTAPTPGHYRATLVHNGQALDLPAVEVEVPASARLQEGFVHVQGLRFVTDAGTPYFPLGHNLGWKYPDSPPLPEQLRRMGAAGMNWARIWACSWDGKNPILIRHGGFHKDDENTTREKAPLGEFLPTVLRQWDEIVAAAEAGGVRFQMVLFHHGLVSTSADSNWDEHPWSKANGGFLDRPQDFFTDETAREYSRRWLRYAVARWGHSPAVLTWELFNEVEWSDAAQKDKAWPVIAAWHAEMGAFVRALDPYHHMVTTSSAIQTPSLYDTMDYYQPHGYPREVFTAIAGSKPLPGKPWFFGEVGRGTSALNQDERRVVRDGLWGGILGGHAGAGCYWFWERVAKYGFENEFTRAGRVLQLSGLPGRPAARPMSVAVLGTAPAPLVVAPGRGWGPTTRFRFDLPGDLLPKNLVELSSMFGLPAATGASAAAQPVEFAFTTPTDGELTLKIGGIAAAGGGLRLMLDGAEVFRRTWPALEGAAGKDPRARQPGPEPLTVPYRAGKHVLAVEGLGPSWVQLESLAIPGLGSPVRGFAIGENEFALVRLTTDSGELPGAVTIKIAGLADGACQLSILDLDSGSERQLAFTVTDGALRDFHLDARDVAIVIRR